MVRYRQEQKSKWISEFRASGETIEQFSSMRPFSKTSLHKWLKQANTGTHIKKSKESKFIPFEIPTSSFQNPKAIIKHPDGLEIKIFEPLTDSLLIKLITSMK